MSRHGYSEDADEDWWGWIRWRGAVRSAIRGKRGQAMLRELLAALDAMPEKRLIKRALEREGEVCALGALGRARGISMSSDCYDREDVADLFGIAEALAAEIMYENDEAWTDDDEERWRRVRAWVARNIEPSEAT